MEDNPCTTITVPMWDVALSLARVVFRAVSMILPHEHLAPMHIVYPAAFVKWARGTTGGVVAFWDAITPNGPRLHGHLVLQQPGFRTHCTLLRLHGDGVPFGNHHTNSAFVASALIEGHGPLHVTYNVLHA